MNSTYLFRLCRVSVLPNLKISNTLFISTRSRQVPLDICSSLLKPITVTKISSLSFWETFPATRTSFHLKDGVDKDGHDLVYRSKLFNYCFYSQLFSMTAITIQVIYSSYAAFRTVVLHETVEKMSHFGPFEIHYDLISMGILGLFTCQNILLYYISQRALLRIYHQNDTGKYVFVSLSMNPFKSRLSIAEPGDLKPLNIENLFAMFGNYNLNGRKMFLKIDNFKNAWHYNVLIGAVDPDRFKKLH